MSSPQVVGTLPKTTVLTPLPSSQAASPVSCLSPPSVSVPKKTGSHLTLLNNRYILTKELGVGGVGRVFQATDVVLKREVAVKLPRAVKFLESGKIDVRELKKELRLLALRELSIAGHLSDSAYIVPVIDAGIADGVPYTVMPLLEGATLQSLLTQRRLTFVEAISMTQSVLLALIHCHQRGVIHADLNHLNVFCTELESVGPWWRVFDFGLSRIVEPEKFRPWDPEFTGQMSLRVGMSRRFFGERSGLVGTPGFMAPEVIRKEGSDQRVDIFAAGVLLYLGCTGVHPFLESKPDDGVGQVIALLNNTLTKAPHPIRDNLPVGLVSVIHKALEKDRRDRFQTALEFYQALQPVEVALTQALTNNPVGYSQVRAYPCRPLL